MEDLTYDDFTCERLKKFKVSDLKSFVKSSKLYKPNKLGKKQEWIDFLMEEKDVIFGLKKQKNILKKLPEERTKCYSMDEVIVGIDEAGQGACAGDLYIGLAILPKHHDDTRWDYITDSKQLSKDNRQIIFEYIKEIAIEYIIHKVTPEEIDRLNVHQAKMKGFCDALAKLKTKVDRILIDGNHVPKQFVGNYMDDLPMECVIKGDGKYKSIAAGSILAKVQRDNDMIELSKEYPEYKWDENKGYCQTEHFDLIKEHGLTKWHRRSYGVCKTEKKIYYKELEN